MAYADGETISVGNYQVYFYKSDAGGFRAEIRIDGLEVDDDQITSYEAAGLVGLLADQGAA
ncbi:hypothetical protein [Kitasatospora sp. MBT66]|uniref:hypothetical protein n=1 Tax=Kitasatospora sp. MBT66 TaxID=1444769 RepID=UPI0011EA6E6E|nr:hypothetical protein [Kitasatospora sp. MBT66]